MLFNSLFYINIYISQYNIKNQNNFLLITQQIIFNLQSSWKLIGYL